MSHAEVVGHRRVACSACGHPNDPRAEWCEDCLVEVEPHRRRRPKRLSTRALGRRPAPSEVPG